MKITALILPIVGSLLLGALHAQEARYLRCETPYDITLYDELLARDDAELIDGFVRYNQACAWTYPGQQFITRDLTDTLSMPSVMELEPTDDPAVLRIWLYGEGPHYVLREEAERMGLQ